MVNPGAKIFLDNLFGSLDTFIETSPKTQIGIEVGPKVELKDGLSEMTPSQT